jgi:hypothetical protein
MLRVSVKKNLKIEKLKAKAMKELSKFYKLNWIYEIPEIFVVDSRRVYDLIRKKKTEKWMTAFTDSKNNIWILAPKAYKTDTDFEFTYDRYFKTIKHELSHCYFNVTMDGFECKWLDEGIAFYLAGQQELFKLNCPKKFMNFLNDSQVDYQECSYAVRLLIERFGEERFKEFLITVKTNKEVSNSFEKIYGQKLSYETFNSFVEQ